jgi:putative sterol carrier protein
MENRTDSGSASQPSGFDTDSLARLIKSMPEEELKAGIAANGAVLIGEIFRRFPERLSEGGKEQNGVIQFNIRGRGGEEVQRWFIVLGNGKCEVGRDLGLQPRTTISLSQLSFVKLVTGNVNPVELFLSRRLRIRGDLVFASRMPGFFKIPRAR